MKGAAIILTVVWVVVGAGALTLGASPIYQVSGRNELFLLEEDKWRYISSMEIIYSLGYTEKDINKNTDIAFWCQYPVGYPMPGGWADPDEYGYTPHKDWYVAACQEIETTPTAVPSPSFTQLVAIAAPRWFYAAPTYPHDITKGIETFKRIKALGYNVVSVNWRPPAHPGSSWTWEMYENVLNAAKQADLLLMPWVGWKEQEIRDFISRYAQETIIWGWYSHDEPMISGASKTGQQTVYDIIKAGDPYNRPVISTFSTASDAQYVKGWQPSSFDIAAFDIYPYAMAGKTQASAEKYLKRWANYWAPRFRKAGKRVIPMLQAFSATKGAPVDILSQYKWWQESRMPLLPDAFATYGTPTHPVLSDTDIRLSDTDAHIYEGIRNLNKKLGWVEETPV